MGGIQKEDGKRYRELQWAAAVAVSWT